MSFKNSGGDLYTINLLKTEKGWKTRHLIQDLVL